MAVLAIVMAVLAIVMAVLAIVMAVLTIVMAVLAIVMAVLAIVIATPLISQRICQSACSLLPVVCLSVTAFISLILILNTST